MRLYSYYFLTNIVVPYIYASNTLTDDPHLVLRHPVGQNILLGRPGEALHASNLCTHREGWVGITTDFINTRVVNPDPVGSGTFFRIRISAKILKIHKIIIINMLLLFCFNFLADIPLKLTWVGWFFFLIDYNSVAAPEPVEPKLFGDMEPEPNINLNKHFLQSVSRMLGRRKANF